MITQVSVMCISYKVEMKKQAHFISEEKFYASERQRELVGLLAKSYEEKVKGVIDDEAFILLIGAFKKERAMLKQQKQKLQEKLEIAQNFLDGLGRFQKMIMGQTKLHTLTREIVGQFIDWIDVYPADRSTKPYVQRIEIHYHYIGAIETD